ncbi:hypothetical protein PR002_g15909 [Phytophthora rubi]|uniref:Uncharacterized protein n=1 Tax=Phytophthora rubi TaxID=129364 RepID=A0A6A3KS60_9STRA|nr:hypothetical protein PR002_g15909 [Phytophthora rubi]
MGPLGFLRLQCLTRSATCVCLGAGPAITWSSTTAPKRVCSLAAVVFSPPLRILRV